MKRPILFVIALMLLFALTGCQGHSSLPVNGTAAIAPLTMEEKINDYENLYKILEENYPFFEVNKRVNGVDWLANKDKYIDMIKKTKSDEEYLATLDSILKDLHNGHVNMLNKEFYRFLKAALEHYDNMSAWRKQLEKPNTVLRYSDNKKTSTGDVNSNNQQAGYARPNNVSTKILQEGKVAYLSIASLNTFNIQDDMKVISPFLESVKDYSALIIDIRQNGGGDSNYWAMNLVPMLIDSPIKDSNYYVYRGGSFSEEFIKNKLQNSYDDLKPISELEKEKLPNMPPEIFTNYKYYWKVENIIYPKYSVGFKGKIYLLVDRHVYSSSEMFASFAKCTGFATLVGETTGGDGIGQDPLIYSLPSGYLVRFPLVMGLTADGSCNEEQKTVPDIQVAAEKNEDISKDAAIQYVLGLY